MADERNLVDEEDTVKERKKRKKECQRKRIGTGRR